MRTGRDDFTKDTIRTAAGRAGYRCSFPGCPNATIGASMETPSKTSVTGVAAHICAASENGPRYDTNMTREGRRAVENCIWMCETHARLIDTDINKYTVEVLRQWKKDAEKRASNLLANSDYFSEYYKNNGDNLSIISQLFNDMILDGQYAILATMLSQYTSGLSEVYEEFVLRYRIVYDVYCCRNSLNCDLQKYCTLPCKVGVEELAELFVSFSLSNELKIIEKYCQTQELKEIILLSISGEMHNKVFFQIGSNPTQQLPEKFQAAISRYASYYIAINQIFGITDQNGTPYQMYKDEFYYKVIAAVYTISSRAVLGDNNFDAIIRSDEFAFIEQNIDRILQLDISVQESIWAGILTFLSVDISQFNRLLNLCPVVLKQDYAIQRAKHIAYINHDICMVDADELLRFSEANGKYDILIMYLSGIDEAEATQFLDEHEYLFKKSSKFLHFRMVKLSDLLPSKRLPLLAKYRELYSKDFLYHCLLANELNDMEIQKELKWLTESDSQIDSYTLPFYIRVLCNNAQWDTLQKLSHARISNECLFYIASYLTESTDDTHIAESKRIYESLIEKGWERHWIRFNLGLVCYRLGYYEDAKKNYCTEFDIYKQMPVLKQFLMLRYETNEFVEDIYLRALEDFIDSDAQNLVGAFYLKLNKFIKARDYFLRSLLINDDNHHSRNGLCQASLHIAPIEMKTIQVDSVCILENKYRQFKIAIHSPDIIRGIKPNEYGSYKHFSSEDPTISCLMFNKVGDAVEAFGEQFIVTFIASSNSEFAKTTLATLINSPNTIKISTSTADEFIREATPILKESSEKISEIVCNYNRQEIQYPLTAFSHVIGKSMLIASEFLLFGNSEKIRNNLSWREKDDEKRAVYILSYGSIVSLVHMGVKACDLKGLEVTCAKQVKRQLISDIDEEFAELSSSNRSGGMFYKDGRISFWDNTPERKRNRYTFLSNLKAFINSVNNNYAAYDFVPNNRELSAAYNTIFVQQRLFCESGTLGLCQHISNGFVVTDEQFLYGVSGIDEISNIGLCAFLSIVFPNWEKLLEFSKKMKTINYGNYLPLFIYKQMVDSVIDDGKNIRNGSEEIQQWLSSDTENKPSEHHEDVVSVLFRDVYSSGYEYLNPNNILGVLAFRIMERRNPDFAQKCVTEVLENIHLSLQASDDGGQIEIK
ncbi:MAG: hypothetical protein RR313_09360 [Anaerovoracaceae bacterium]